MAKFEDYLPQGAKDPLRSKEGIDDEIDLAADKQATRQTTDSTSLVDWETRYKELERLNSRQAQTLGDYRKTIDEFIMNPTPSDAATGEEEPTPITYEDLYTNPNDAIHKSVDTHPAIQEVQALKQQRELDKRMAEKAKFVEAHSDYEEIANSPEFQNWVIDSPTRVDLYQRGHDFNAADALFSLYKAEKGVTAAQNQQDIDQAELVSSSGELVVEPAKYSRSEYISKLTKARQGNLEAEDWVKRNAAGYRQALEVGNVRD